uniref:Uncharacterized protein n=1 Tax=Cacopsylla melanoneura TaxID=428564 RepID=A0A8D8TZI5_9HEMI
MGQTGQLVLNQGHFMVVGLKFHKTLLQLFQCTGHGFDSRQSVQFGFNLVSLSVEFVPHGLDSLQSTNVLFHTTLYCHPARAQRVGLVRDDLVAGSVQAEFGQGRDFRLLKIDFGEECLG